MSRTMVGAVFGALLLATGVLLLLEALGVLIASGLFWGALFVTAAGVFWYWFAIDRQAWWAAIPGGALAGLGLVMLADEAQVAGEDRWGGVLFLAGIGAGFAAVYLRERDRWWAVIPAGVLLTLAVQAGLTEDGLAEPLQGALFFAGLALTFALVAVLPGGSGRRWWAWIPATVLAVLGVLSALEATDLWAVFNYLWPVGLILAGGVLLWRALGARRGSSAGPNAVAGPSSAPSTRDPAHAAEPHSREEL
ncbi:hypothetical protein RCG67_06125 [Kocuria sp. CPCC 205292]|uniref:hypothetical protein n=1 Tax=Kocuria cellulosilytica TaxID=3071451 RepID=UPI0034D58CD1